MIYLQFLADAVSSSVTSAAASGAATVNSAQPSAGESAAGLLPFFVILVVFYFLVLRPQQRKAKDHQSMIAALDKGDRVVTGGGIIGKVVKVDNDMISVEIAQGVTVQVARATVVNVLGKEKADKKVKSGSIANDN